VETHLFLILTSLCSFSLAAIIKLHAVIDSQQRDISYLMGQYQNTLLKERLCNLQTIPAGPQPLVMTGFLEKQNNAVDIWHSPPVYTSDQGYKICLGVCANGRTESRFVGTHVSVSVFFMQGDFDSTLTWPF